MLKRIIVKVGTRELMNGKKHLRPEVFASIAAQISLLAKNGTEIAVVSSGAIQAGREHVQEGCKLAKKELAGIGNRYLLNLWGDAFRSQGREVAQILATYSNWENRKERENIRKGIEDYLEAGVIPIINENDVISDEEIRWMEQGISENDKLARMIAELLCADGTLFLTHAGGIYDKDPERNLEARILEKITVTEEELEGIRKAQNSNKNNVNSIGTGGIEVKHREAALCLENKNIQRVVVAGNKESDIVRKFVYGENVKGTEIVLKKGLS